MASQTTIQQLVNYYVGTLIVQYNIQPKAQAHINLLATVMMCNAVMLDVLNGYNLITENGAQIAQGTQLDVLGKYAGVNRFYPELILQNYWAAVTYSQASSLPTSPPAFGCSKYATFGSYDYNGSLTYADIITTNEALIDSAFYTLIQLAIIQNNMNYSAGAIDTVLFKFFGTSLRAEYSGAMSMAFFVGSGLSALIQAIIFKKLLPVPIAVSAVVVSQITGLMFGLESYYNYSQGNYSAFAYGCSKYSNYVTLQGQTLTYLQMTSAN